MGTDAHRAAAAAKGPIPVGLVTVSDTRTTETDENGSWLRERVEASGNRVSGYQLVRDEPDEVRAAVDELVAEARVVLVNGGTGVSGRDTTYDTLAALLEKTLPGFGELFRMLSFAEIGAAAMLSRAVAGTIGRTAVFALPGSENAVRLAMTRLIIPELGHVVRELRR